MRKKVREELKQKLDIKNKILPLEVWPDITVKDIAVIFKCNIDDIQLFIPGVTHNDKLSVNDILILSKQLQKKCKFIKNPNTIEESHKMKPLFVKQPPPKPENLIIRPPVVTIMGHVDHGKTTLLDSLRNTFVVSEEFGGITQHIGAFSVEVKPGKKITFIDTPGHAAFTTMRARGVNVTDLVVLVVAADDGVMPQTVESIKIANNAGVKMVVALNKIDAPQAMNIEIIKDNLLNEGIQVEDRGGDVQIVPISALKKINLDLLLDMILLEADVMNLKGDPTGFVEGVIIESKQTELGPVTTMLVKRGTLKKGTILVTGPCYARVRRLLDENGKECTEALPSTPVQVFGWKELPEAGAEVLEVASEKQAHKIVRIEKQKILIEKQKQDINIITEKAALLKKQHYETQYTFKSLKTIQEKKEFLVKKRESQHKVEVDNTPHIKLILKGDVHGSLEVLMEILSTYDQHEVCKMSVISASVGKICESDLELAEVFNAIIYAFNVDFDANISALAVQKNINVHFHNVIYKMIDDLKSEINDHLPLQPVERIQGEAIVNQNFYINQGNKKVPVAGCKCTKGELQKNSKYKIVRGNDILYDGTVVSMKHHKTEVQTVHKNTECGLMFNSFTTEFKPSDKIICYNIEEVPQTTNWEPGY
ncbi:hypothetical protein RUM44_012639 [Polyplax serrata]|uniref:Tr-type G domain-containing protein n=1 Tax=Polyplax serrata TaxID=468196 RepID=A0ABR1BFP0_POLSC